MKAKIIIAAAALSGLIGISSSNSAMANIHVTNKSDTHAVVVHKAWGCFKAYSGWGRVCNHKNIDKNGGKVTFDTHSGQSGQQVCATGSSYFSNSCCSTSADGGQVELVGRQGGYNANGDYINPIEYGINCL